MKAQSPCYPESAVELTPGDRQKNYGTDGELGPAGLNPGQDCTSPGPYNGAYVDPRDFFG